MTYIPVRSSPIATALTGSEGVTITQAGLLRTTTVSAIKAWVLGSTSTTPTPTPITLVPAGPTRSSANNQIIENLDITAATGDALVVTHSGVTVRNCRIQHATGQGVSAQSVTGLTLTNLEVIRNVPSPNVTNECDNVYLYNSPGANISNIRASRGSGNMYIDHSPNCTITNVELHDVRGPFPRGQNVQFSNSPDSVLQDFSGENGSTSLTEDLVSAYFSDRCIIRRGLVFYNNSPSGDGVMLEGSSVCHVEDVDAVSQGNGAFGVAAGASGCFFLRCRTRDSYNSVRDGRAAPSSNSLSFAMNTSGALHTITDCHYDNLANPGNLLYQASAVAAGYVITPLVFTARAPIRLTFPWS